MTTDFNVVEVSQMQNRSPEKYERTLKARYKIYKIIAIPFTLFFCFILWKVLDIINYQMTQGLFMLPIIFVLFYGVGFIIFYKYTYGSINAKKEIFKRGKIIYADVLEHRTEVVRTGTGTSGSRSQRYYIDVEIQDTNKKKSLGYINKYVFENYPVGSTIIGLSHNGEQEFGVRDGIKFVKNEM